MKLFFTVLVLAAAASAGDKEYRKLKKWAMHKACESCLGSEATKQHMIKIKSAAATCMKMDAPELDLPMYKYPSRAVSALVDGAFSAFDHNSDGHHEHPHMHRPGDRPMGHHHQQQGPMGSSSSYGDSDDDYLTKMMKRVFFKKLVSKMIEEEFMDEDEDEEDGMTLSPGPMRFFKKQRRNHFRRHRRAAAASDYDSKKEMFELGDRLNAKLQSARAKMEAEIGNYTCMLQQCGIMNEDKKLASAEEIVRQFKRFPLNGDSTDGWLRSKLEEGIYNCHAFAMAVPQEVLDKCPYGPDLARVKMYKKCFKMCKMQTCMSYDVKTQLEENFGGSLEQLVETTQLEETELLPLVMTLLHGPEMDM